MMTATRREECSKGDRADLIDSHFAATLAPVDFIEHSLELRDTLVRGSLNGRLRKTATTRAREREHANDDGNRECLVGKTGTF